MFSEDPILLPEIADQIVLVTVHPASEREDEELQRRRHSLRLLGRLDQHRPSLGRFFAPYGLINAVVASGISAADYADPFDSVWIDLSKGLGAPVGGVLAGSLEFIDRAWRFKHQFGGAMRQSGIIAAAGVYALDKHVDRLADDHTNARRFAEALAQIPDIGIDADQVETNMVYFEVRESGLDAAEVANRLLERGVRIGAVDRYQMRAVTHLDVDRAGVEEAAKVLSEVVGS